MLGGLSALSEVMERWPLLRAASVESEPLGTAIAPAGSAAAALRQLVRAMRSLDGAALRTDGWVGRGVAAVSGGWGALMARFGRAADAYDRRELSEKVLFEAMAAGAAKATGLVAPEDIGNAAGGGGAGRGGGSAGGSGSSAGSDGAGGFGQSESGVWAGVRTSKAGREPSSKRPLRMAGAASNPAMHAIVRLADPTGSGVAAGRTLFFSNGAVPHHWQHRVFSDGEVFDPIVEDEVPDVDRADETVRLMSLYGHLREAVHAAAAALGAAAPASVPATSFEPLLVDRLVAATAHTAGLLPPGFPIAQKVSLSVRRVLRPDGTPGKDDDEAAAPPGVDSGHGGSRAAAATTPSHWYLHVLCARLEDVPSVRWAPDVEGALLYEETFALDGRGGARPLTAATVPLLSCWPAEGAEESEARQVRGAVCSNSVCTKLHLAVERMRAGEHHVLQALAAPPEEAVTVLTSSSWLPSLVGELRLFTGGLCFDTDQHGPHVLPFRIHVDAAAAYQIDHRTADGLLLLRQKPDTHGSACSPLARLLAAACANARVHARTVDCCYLPAHQHAPTPMLAGTDPLDCCQTGQAASQRIAAILRCVRSPWPSSCLRARRCRRASEWSGRFGNSASQSAVSRATSCLRRLSNLRTSSDCTSLTEHELVTGCEGAAHGSTAHTATVLGATPIPMRLSGVLFGRVALHQAVPGTVHAVSRPVFPRLSPRRAAWLSAPCSLLLLLFVYRTVQ